MLSLLGESFRLCDGVSRREALRVGGLGLLGLSLPELLRARQAAGDTTAALGRAKSCIVLFMLGGPPQHETWDPKPDAPSTIKGDWKPIASRVPGLLVGELMPLTAQRTDKLCVLRAMSTQDNAHMSSGYAMLTGFEHALGKNREDFPVTPEDRPSLGGLVKHMRPGPPGLPSAVVLPEPIYNNPHVVWPGQTGGFLGRVNDPWLVECDVSPGAGFEIPQLRLSDDLPALRMSRRRDLLGQVDRHLATASESLAFSHHDAQFRQAFDLLRGARVRRAFDLEREEPRLRDRYGRHKWGQCCLLARRLVEAGVPLVQVNWPRDTAANGGNPCWDIHNDGVNRLKNHLMPPMDQGFSALLDDLDMRGLLDETLVVWMGEFGRTPQIRDGGSRDHWGSVFSIALAGAGIRGGQVHGASDRIGAQPRDGRVVPADLAATILACLGISPETEIHDTLGRPLPVSRGTPLTGLF